MLEKELTWSEIFKKALKHKKMLIYANIVAILATLVNVPTPIFMPILVDEIILEKRGFFTHYVDIFLSGCSAECYVFIAFLVVTFLRFAFYILNVIQNRIFITISKTVVFEIRQRVLRQIGKTSLSEFENIGSGKIASMLVSDINTIDDFLGVSISRLVISVLTVIGVAGVLIAIHPWLGLFIVLLNPAIVMLSSRFARAVSKYKKEENASIATFSDKLSEALDVFWQIKASNKESIFSTNILKEARDIKDKSIAFNYNSDKSIRFSYLIFLVGFELFRAVAIITVFYSDLSIGYMLAIFGYLWVMMTPVQEILNIQYSYQNASRALKRINELISLEKEPEYPKNENPFAHESLISLQIKNGYFEHKDGSFVMKDINFLAKKGSITAIVGASGSGKSTLAHILVGFYYLKSGEFLINGIDVKQIGLDILRENVFLILQSPFILNDTLRENLTFGEDISDQKLINALKIAKFLDVYDNLPDGLDTKLGKNGVRLSGGQRQRVAIARMIVKDPSVVIFDESTSALDVDTERVLFEELEPFLKGKTVIIIAHRLSTIENADYIYSVKDGTIK